MAARGKKSDLDFTVSYNAEKAIADMAKQIAKQDQIIGKVKSQNKVTKDAMRQMKKSYKDAGDEAGRTKKQVGGIGKAADGATTKVLAFVGGFATIAGVSTALKAVLGTLREINQLRTDSLADAVIVEKLAMPTAHLQTDVSQEKVRATERRQAEIAKSEHVSLQIAERALFFSESELPPGSPEALASAKSIVAFAAPPGLTPEEVEGIPKIFAALGAKTREEQMRALNKLVVATGGSSAETGPYVKPLSKLLNTLLETGFTYDQVLARMTSMIAVGGKPATAAEDVERYTNIVSGQRSPKTLDFLAGEAKKKGVDFRKLSVPERVASFEKDIYPYFKDDVEKMDILSQMMGGEAVKVVRLGASKRAQEKLKEMLPKIIAATDATYVQDMRADYADSPTARSFDAERRRLVASAASGRKYEAVGLLDKEVTTVLAESKKATADWGDVYWRAIRTEGMERQAVAKEILRQNLKASIPVYGTKEYAAAAAGGDSPEEKKFRLVQGLLSELATTVSLDANPELKQQIYDITEGFSAVERTGRLSPRDTFLPDYDDLPVRGMAAVYGIDDLKQQREQWQASADVYQSQSLVGAPQQEVAAAVNRLEALLGKVVEAVEKVVAANEKTSQAVEKVVVANENTKQAVNNANDNGTFELGEGGLD